MVTANLLLGFFVAAKNKPYWGQPDTQAIVVGKQPTLSFHRTGGLSGHCRKAQFEVRQFDGNPTDVLTGRLGRFTDCAKDHTQAERLLVRWSADGDHTKPSDDVISLERLLLLLGLADAAIAGGAILTVWRPHRRSRPRKGSRRRRR